MMKRYSQILLFSITILLLISASIVTLADPRGLFRPFWNNLLGLSALEANGSRLEKSLHALAEDFQIYLLGSSRVQVGLDPRSKALTGARTYNLGLSATNTTELNHILRSLAHKHNPPAHVLYGLDFESFNSNRIVDPGYDASWFNQFGSIQWIPRYLLSSSSIREAIRLIRQSSSNTNQAVFSDRLGLLDKSPTSNAVDHRSLIEQVLRTNFLVRKETFASFPLDTTQYDDLRTALQDALDHDVKVTLFMSPVHAWHTIVMDELGLTDQYADWKREITRISEQLNKRWPGRINLWDFSGINSVTAEAIPDTKQQMQFYWETSHYKLRAGDLMLNTMVNEERSTDHTDFGYQLSKANVEVMLTQEQQLLRQWKAGHADDLATIQKLIKQTENQRKHASGP